MSLSYSSLFLLRPTRPTILISDLLCLFPHHSSIDILCLNSSWCSHYHLIPCHLRYPLPISVCLSVCFSLFLSLNLSLLIHAISLFIYLSHLTPSFHLPLSTHLFPHVSLYLSIYLAHRILRRRIWRDDQHSWRYRTYSCPEESVRRTPRWLRHHIRRFYLIMHSLLFLSFSLVVVFDDPMIIRHSLHLRINFSYFYSSIYQSIYFAYFLSLTPYLSPLLSLSLDSFVCLSAFLHLVISFYDLIFFFSFSSLGTVQFLAVGQEIVKSRGFGGLYAGFKFKSLHLGGGGALMAFFLPFFKKIFAIPPSPSSK